MISSQLRIIIQISFEKWHRKKRCSTVSLLIFAKYTHRVDILKVNTMLGAKFRYFSNSKYEGLLGYIRQAPYNVGT